MSAPSPVVVTAPAPVLARPLPAPAPATGSNGVPNFSATSPESASLRELRLVTPTVAKATWDRLMGGYKDKFGASFGPAVRTDTGCFLAQKGTNKEVSCNAVGAAGQTLTLDS